MSRAAGDDEGLRRRLVVELGLSDGAGVHGEPGGDQRANHVIRGVPVAGQRQPRTEGVGAVQGLSVTGLERQQQVAGVI